MASTKRKRTSIRVACNPCRNKKVACDGNRPICWRCSATAVQCVYDTSDAEETRGAALKKELQLVKQEKSESEVLLMRLRSLPDQESMDLLRQLRRLEISIPASGSSTAESFGPWMYSRYTPARPMLSPASYGFAYDLTPSQTAPYPTAMDHLGENGLLTGKDLHELVTHHSQSWQHRHVTDSPQSSRTSPVRPPSYTDPRLRQLDISYWTKVHISNDFAANMLSLYLEIDHPVLGFFDADLFIADLVGKDLRFCSPLLVSSLLFWSCQSYSSVDNAASFLCFEFLHEAQHLWEAISASSSSYREDSFLTAAALQFLSLGCAGIGNDTLGLEYQREGTEMAETIGLIGLPSSPISEQNEYSPELYRAMSHTAWGIFNWLTLRSIHYRVDIIKYSPLFPIPSHFNDAENNAAIDPAFSVYSDGPFAQLCKFWLIVQEFALFYYNADPAIPLQNRVPLAFAESIHRKLLNWASSVSTSLPNDRSEPAHWAIVQIWYHSVLTDLFRPFTGQKLTLHSFGNNETSPDDVVLYSLNQLKFHLLTFRHRHTSASYGIFWHPACMYVANAVLAEADSDPEWSSYYFHLCVRYYQTLSFSFQIAITLLQSLLDMATKKKFLSIDESRSILDKACQNGLPWMTTPESTSAYKVDLNLAIARPGAGHIASLAKAFKDKAVVEEEDGEDGEDDAMMFKKLTNIDSDSAQQQY